MSGIVELLQKFSDKTITSEEEDFLFGWLRTHQDEWMLSMYDEYRQLFDHHTAVLEKAKSDELLHGIHKQIGVGENDREPIRPARIKTGLSSTVFYRVAAAVIAGFCLLTWWYADSGETFIPLHDTAGNENKRTLTDHENSGNTVQLIALTDGSTVWLYPQSRIMYPDSFAGAERQVTLLGKAFFEVARNEKMPFIVISNEMTTKVLGTSFMVDAFTHQSRFSVMVRTGKVAVSAKSGSDQMNTQQKTVALKANETIILNRSTTRFTAPEIQDKVKEKFPVEPSAETDYRFRETPVTTILEMLEKDYQVRIRVEGEPLSSCLLTTSLSERSFLEKLKVICAGIGPSAAYTLKDGEVIIHSKGCDQ